MTSKSFRNLLLLLQLSLVLSENISSNKALNGDKTSNGNVITHRMEDDGTLMKQAVKEENLAPSPTTVKIDLGNNVTEYEIISYWLTTNDNGSTYTAKNSIVYSPPTMETFISTNMDEIYVENDVISYFITTDEQGEIITDSVVHTSTVETIHITYQQVQPNNVTLYEWVIYERATYWNGNLFWSVMTEGLFLSPTLKTIVSTNSDEGYIEKDVISYSLNTIAESDFVKESIILMSREKLDTAVPYTSLGPAPPNTTKTVDLGNNVTEYVVISYWVTTDSYGGFVTASNSSVYSPPAVTTTDRTNTEEAYVETDVISYFITTDGKGEIVTESVVVKSRQKIDSAAAHTSLGPAPPNTTKTVDLGNNVTEYVVISYWVTTDSYGGFVTASNSSVYSPPAVTTTDRTNTEEAYVETDVISYFITTDGKGEIVTESVVVKSRQKIDSAAARTSLGPAPPNTTKTVDLGNNVTEYVVISYWVTTDSYGGFVTASNSSVYSPPAVTTTDRTNTEEAYVETDVISYFITTDGKGEIVTDSAEEHFRVKLDTKGVFQSFQLDSSSIDKIGSSGRSAIVSFATSSGNTNDNPNVETHSDSIIVNDSVQFVTTTDSDGKPVVIGTSETIESNNCGNSCGNPGYSTSSIDNVKDDYTNTITDSDGSVEVVHHGTTTNLAGNIIITTVTELPASTIEDTAYVSDGETIHKEVIISLYTDSDGTIATSTWTKLYKTLAGANSVYLSSEQQSSTILSTTSSTNSVKSVIPANIPNSSGTVINKFSNQLTVITTNGQQLTAFVSDVTTQNANGNPTTPTKTVPTTPTSSGPIPFTSVTYGSHPTSQSIISPNIFSQQLHNAAISVDIGRLHFYLLSLFALLLL
ncbi:some similarities with uniprot [Nakaseomyces bracarensis]|uniref:Some similarities with uniprot n=1 Tax=Nakaseomyces bracarensis TaxID=273131 RepID=A0ABR4NNH3_9SACH